MTSGRRLLSPITSTRKVAITVKLEDSSLMYQQQYHSEPVQPELHLGGVISLEPEVEAGGTRPRNPDVDHHVLPAQGHRHRCSRSPSSAGVQNMRDPGILGSWFPGTFFCQALFVKI